MTIVAVLYLTGCAEPVQTPRHYGTGEYHCYGQNMHTGRLLKGKAEEKRDAVEHTMILCDADAPNIHDEKECVFVDCVFK